MAIRTKKRIGDNKAFICVKDKNGQLTTKPVSIFGSVRLIVGEKASDEMIAQLVQDLRQKKFKQSIKLELCTGGEYIEELGGYKNWFPGCTAYGVLRTQDANLLDANGQQVYDSYGNAVYVPMWGQGNTLADATVEILNVIDNVMTDPELQAALNIKYRVRTASGEIGYISAGMVTDIFYKVKH